jgi:thiosulfate reductase cytochrome b subunit
MATIAPTDPIGIAAPSRFYRHRLIVRLTHWTNVVAICVMLMSGMQIFVAHPALYWGQYGADSDNGPRWFEIGSIDAPNGKSMGVTQIGPLTFDTTGVLGLSKDATGQLQAIAFPGWATLPSYRDLATGRRWHFFFAWVFALNWLTMIGSGMVSRHLRRDVLPTKNELRPSNILHDIGTHIRLRFPKGEEAKRYHILQKLAYCGVLFGLLPLMILTGLTMSPSNDAAWGWLMVLFAGRQSARSIHFISATLIVAFVIVHLAMVLLAGPINEIRSMITGWFTIPPEDAQ